MYLESIYIKNFRNLAEVTIPIARGTVIVGENRSGKSNLLHALRLVLDPTLPNSERTLGREDFWDGLGRAERSETTEPASADVSDADGEQASSEPTDRYDPMAAGEQIVVRVEFGGIDGDAEAMGSLGGALIEGNPMRASFTYRFAPREMPEGHIGPPLYEWKITGGVTDEELRGDVRKYVRMTSLSALRDVESDIGSWRRSPLRPLLDAASKAVPEDDLRSVADAVSAANQLILKLDPVSALGDQITGRTKALVGTHQGLEAALGIAPTEPHQLLRSLRLFVDGAQRRLGTASLGALNVLYLALLLLRLEKDVADGEVAHLVLGIEEPEAHLHPHVQRTVFADVLRPAPRVERTVVVTSHSPHLVGVAPAKSLVVLRSTPEGTYAGAASAADLEPREWGDMQRYLDATRAEIVFAQRVLLVEGYAEVVLLPRMAAALGYNLDELGVSVCAVNGTHFGSYARYLEVLGTPWAVVTDGDPSKRVTGARRVELLLERLGRQGDDPADHGVFLGAVTLEQDLIEVGPNNAKAALASLATLPLTQADLAQIKSWQDSGDGTLDAAAALEMVKDAGKGAFAQRLSAMAETIDPPAYVKNALTYLVG